MAKKKTAKPMSAHNRVALHVSITGKVSAMIARAERLRDEGRIDDARKLLLTIERLTKELKTLEK